MSAVPAPLRQAGRARSLLDLYLATARTSITIQFQYRAATFMYMLGMVAEPIVYIVVWSTIARSHGGTIEGYTPGTFAAYYIVWTLVRNMNIVFTPYGWEERVREGTLANALLRPVHPIHHDLAGFIGMKFVWFAQWLPIGAVLALAFRPSLHPTVLQVAVFAMAIWGAYLIRSLNLWSLGLITLWTTRIGAIYEAFFIAELLLSGRLVPMALMPGWVRTLSWFLPFRWTFGFPITALVGPISNRDLLIGLAMQALWIAIGTAVMQLVWKRGVRRFASVGG